MSLLGIVVAAFALIGVLHTTRGTPIKRVDWSTDHAPTALPSGSVFENAAPMLCRLSMQSGHVLEILANGDDTYRHLWTDLRGAQRTITMQLYYCEPGRMAHELGDILVERARAGVDVHFVHDAFGAQSLGSEYLEALRRAGVRTAAFRPLRWYSLHKAQHRSHVRLVVIDGRVAYTGCFGLADKWYGDGRHPGQWRDTNVRCTGPAVAQFQAAFAAAWAETTSELLMSDALFPPHAQPGADEHAGVRVGLLVTSPTLGSTDAERFLTVTIAGARRTLYIANGYFAPNGFFRRLLAAAARRGVDVRVLTAGDQTDIKTLWHAGRAGYEELLAAGVRIYEYRPSMMHAKTLVADHEWSAIGSMSFDNRALALNVESTLVVHDSAFGARMDAMFFEDLEYANEIQLDAWRRRPWRNRLLERGVSLLARLL